jgi:hypothetical protein
VFWKCGKVQVSGKDTGIPKWLSRRNEEGIELGECCYHLFQNLLYPAFCMEIIKFKIYGTIALPVILYGYPTWFLTWREDRRLPVFQNRVLRKIFGSERDEVTRDWKKLHNEEHRYLYSSPSIIQMIGSRKMRWVGHVAVRGEG